jgi:hypothetical protein
MTKIVNLTPHTVTIIRSIPDPTGAPVDRINVTTAYPACDPALLPRATESIVVPNMSLTDAASDGQGGYANSVALAETGIVDNIGYTGTSGLPALTADDRMFGVSTFYIVSIVTAIGALAEGRGIEDLLIPMGQQRDAAGRIIGATSLAPASALLTPMYEAIAKPIHDQLMVALAQRNDARDEARRNVADMTAQLAKSTDALISTQKALNECRRADAWHGMTLNTPG